MELLLSLVHGRWDNPVRVTTIRSLSFAQSVLRLKLTGCFSGRIYGIIVLVYRKLLQMDALDKGKQEMIPSL
jgi:hypothetical protein